MQHKRENNERSYYDVFRQGLRQCFMRDIASEVGIKAASIYNHFPSKRDILKSIFHYYAEEHLSIFPNVEKALLLLETEEIMDVLLKMNTNWPPDLQDKMDRIVMIAGQRMCLDKDSEDFVRENIFKPQTEILIPLLKRAIELGKIEPIDIDTFTKLVMYYTLSVSGLNRTAMKLSIDEWNSGMAMLFSLLKPARKRR